MRAACRALSAYDAAPQGRAIAIVADRPADIARLEELVSSPALGDARIVYRGDLTGFAARQGPPPADLALLHIADALNPARCAAIEALTRRLKVLVIGDSEVVHSCGGVQAARTWAVVNSGDLCPSGLGSVIAVLTQARESEDRLLRAYGDQGARLHRIAKAAAFVPAAVERTKDAIWRLAGLAGMGAAANEAGDAVAQAFDVIDGLESLNDELVECLKMSPVAPVAAQAVDLNEAVEDFARGCAAAGVNSVSVQTGCDPIGIKAAAAELRHLLDTLMATWRETRQPNDKLELLAWDAGAEARLAIVLSKNSSLEDAKASAPASVTMHNIFRRLQPLALACGASVEAGWAPAGLGDFAAMTICLPKQAPARMSAALAPFHGAPLEPLSVRGLAG